VVAPSDGYVARAFVSAASSLHISHHVATLARSFHLPHLPLHRMK